MIDYLLCAIFWLVFTVFIYSFGKAITKRKETSFSYGLLLGYLFYSFFVALGGIPLQLLNVQWGFFAVYMAIVWIAILVFTIYIWKKLELYTRFMQGGKSYIANNWILYVVCAVLVLMMLCYYAGFWLGNHQDDGYYITKVSTLPYGTIGGNYNYALGVENQGFNSYIVNTWELEASVYVKLLGVQPTLYLRLFQSAFYYFLLLNLLKAFSEKLLDGVNQKKNLGLAQYSAIIILLFGMHYLFLSDTYIFRLRDMFHFNTGMFLGISVVKMMSVLFFLLFFMRKRKITCKMLIGVAGIATVLISKSTVALPIIVVLTLAALIEWLFVYYGKTGRIASITLLAVYILTGIILPNQDSIQAVVWDDMINAVRSPVIGACAVVFVLSFTLKEDLIRKINCIFLMVMAFILLPEINDVFEMCSVYNFVGGRSLTTFLYFFVMLNAVYFILLLSRLSVKAIMIKVMYLFGGVGLICVMFAGFKAYGGGVLPDNPRVGASIKYCLSVIKNNKYFIPESTVELGEKLESIADDTGEKLHVVTPKIEIVDGVMHPVSIMMRIYAPDIVSVSASERYPANDGSDLSEYKQQAYDTFVTNPTNETADAFEQEIEGLGVNCIVVRNPQCGEWLQNMGYSLQDETGAGGYYIWCK